MGIFYCEIPGDIQMMKEAVCGVINYLQDYYGPLSEHTLFELKVILNELISNAIKHGIKENKKRFVKVVACLKNNDNACIMVEDEGEGYDYNWVLHNEVMNMANMSDDLCSLAENGRGIIIVKSLCDRMRFNRKGNRVVVLKKLE